MSSSDPTLFERLAKVEPAKLARLLVELAAQDQTILEQVQLLLASGDTAVIAKAVRSTLRAWKRSLPFIHYQEAFAFGEQLDRLLDSMEDGLLGPDPALALDLVEEFLQSDRWILERVDDSPGCIGTAYRRACQLFARAAAGVASPDALAERIALLVEKDDYGVRHSLLEHVPQFLDSETIARLVDRTRTRPATCAAWASWLKRSARGRRLHPMSCTCRPSGRGMTASERFGSRCRRLTLERTKLLNNHGPIESFVRSRDSRRH